MQAQAHVSRTLRRVPCGSPSWASAQTSQNAAVGPVGPQEVQFVAARRQPRPQRGFATPRGQHEGCATHFEALPYALLYVDVHKIGSRLSNRNRRGKFRNNKFPCFLKTRRTKKLLRSFSFWAGNLTDFPTLGSFPIFPRFDFFPLPNPLTTANGLSLWLVGCFGLRLLGWLCLLGLRSFSVRMAMLVMTICVLSMAVAVVVGMPMLVRM